MPTLQEKQLIYAKTLQDPTFGIESFLEVDDQTQGGFVPFKLFPKQKEIVASLEAGNDTIVLKPRQAGVSTTTAGYGAIKVGFADPNSPEKILIIANKQKLAQEMLRKIKKFIGQIPTWVGIKMPTNSKSHIILNNGSEVMAVATSLDAARGFSPTLLIMDEAAYIDGGDVLFAASQASLSTGGKSILISTPNGLDPLYYKTYDGAVNGTGGGNGFTAVEMRWFQDPRYAKDIEWVKQVEGGDPIIVTGMRDDYASLLKDGYKPTSTWYRSMCGKFNHSARMIAQELDCSFIGSGGNVVSEEDIQFQELNNVQEPIRKEGPEKNVWIWEEPVDGRKYLLGCDVSRGDSEDSSSFVIIDFETNIEVAEFIGKIPPDILAKLVYDYGNMYNAYVIVDIAGGMGVATVLKLIELEYKNLHYDDPRSKILSSRKDLTAYGKGDKVPGFNVGPNRAPMLAEFEKQVRLNEVKVRSSRLTSEMKTFVYKNGKADHMKGYHDDLIMALSMSLWIAQISFKNLEKFNSKTKVMLDSWVNTDTSQQINVQKHNSNKTITPNGQQIHNPKSQGQQDYQQFGWLFGAGPRR